MVFNDDFYLKYVHEKMTVLRGLYSLFDARVIYSAVRDIKPKKILDLGTREGRTTSSIIQALARNNNSPIDYYVFEKDNNYRRNIIKYLADFCDVINVHAYSNVIDESALKDIGELDLLFIDAFHDHLLPKWYIKTLFPKVKKGGLIHIHDIYYNKNGNKWDDVGFNAIDLNCDDWSSVKRLKEIYGEDFFNEYYDLKNPRTNEEDVIKNFIVSNNIEFFSTHEEISIKGIIDVPSGAAPVSCSLYFKKD